MKENVSKYLKCKDHGFTNHAKKCLVICSLFTAFTGCNKAVNHTNGSYVTAQEYLNNINQCSRDISELKVNTDIVILGREKFNNFLPEKSQLAFQKWLNNKSTEINKFGVLPWKDVKTAEAKEFKSYWDNMWTGYLEIRKNAPELFSKASTVYRGMDIDKKSLEFYLSQKQTGKPIALGRYGQEVWSSTSRHPKEALKFLGSNIGNDSYHVMLKINQKSGMAVEAIANSQYYFQREVLIPPKAKFKLTKIEALEGNGVPDNTYLISMEEVN